MHKINSYGQEGWELFDVEVIGIDKKEEPTYICWHKRPLRLTTLASCQTLRVNGTSCRSNRHAGEDIWPIAAVVLLSVFLASCKTAARKTSSGVSRLATGTIQAVGKTSVKSPKKRSRWADNPSQPSGKQPPKLPESWSPRPSRPLQEWRLPQGKLPARHCSHWRKPDKSLS